MLLTAKSLIFTTLLILAGIVLYASQKAPAEPGRYDHFAQCLTEKGATLYGAATCLYCQKEKEAFGDSFRLISYVECPKNPKECLAQNVQNYPTWIFADGKRLTGLQGLGKLSQESGCSLERN